MTEVVELEKARLDMAVKRGYRNWKTRFGEDFGVQTRLADLSFETLAFLAGGRGKNTFYLFDLIMGVEGLGSGFEFHDLESAKKIAVMDRYIFVLDRVRFEYMKRLGWLEGYPGEEYTLVELIRQFDRIGPNLQLGPAELAKTHPGHDKFGNMNAFEKEEFLRKLMAKAIQELEDHSTTL